jgi:hypothetical protein
MTRTTLCFLLLLAVLLAACNPEQNQPSRQQTPAPPEPDSLPADGTAVTAGAAAEAPKITPLPDSSRYQINRSQVGPIKIGMPVARLPLVVPTGQLREVAISREGQGFKAYEVGGPPAGLLVEEKCTPACRVWRIQVKDPAYRTAEGLGIGSTLGEVKKYYPISFLGSGETEIVAVSDQKKITFLLDVSRLPAATVPRLNVTNTPDSVKVLGLVVL